METLISIPLVLGREQTLHIRQKPKNSSGGFIAALQSFASGIPRSGAIHVQHVPAGAPAVLDVCADQKMTHNVTDDYTDKTQTVVINTVSTEPVQIYLRWPKGSKEAGLGRLHLQSGDYNINLELDAPSVPATATHLSLSDIDFVPARELIVSSNSGDVSGLLPMEDVLDVSTKSGSANLTLLPLFDKPFHASKLSIKTNSGTLRINANLGAVSARAHFPSRESSIVLQSSSGSIRSVLGMTRSITINSNSGSQHLTALLTDHSRDRRSDFASTTNSGSQNITIVAAGAAAAAPEETLAGAEKADETGFVCKHKSSSGSVRVAYPDSWQGTLEAYSNSGSVAVIGEGVETDKVRNRVTGVKGNPAHHSEVGASSGSISVKFGGT
ncbi:hypothetical protein BBO_05983 [Beauveria brongniartii RCEF 3172]|uniref:DUF4097 domain-containing protein n=1 Tax=Beauveria brongniartii RCEF 3172 TaxID=1081107 RepID=A0A167BTM6_9HYPO|nr:hypothetical protein BBO_05983 [Beauveria brongniartii RCEF 3172]